MNMLFDNLFAPHQDKDRPFLIDPTSTITPYSDFLRRAARMANGLRECGVCPGDRVAVQLEKSVDGLAIMAAAFQAGAILLPLNTGYTIDELDYFLGNSGARLFLCDPARFAALAPVAAQNNCRIESLGADQNGSFAEIIDPLPDEFETVPRGPDDLAAFLYTSGTTGRPKGAMLSHHNLLSNAQTLKELWRFSEKDILLHALPIFHTHGLFVGTNITLLAGGAMILLPKFETNEAIRLLPDATCMMGVPTFYTRLLADPRFDKDLCKRARLFVSGSAPLLAETHRQFEARSGHRILERYGMTETNMNTSNPYEGERRAGSVGLPLPDVELRICDESGRELPRGEIGMIELRGPNLFHGYWQMPEKTAQDMREDGFFITGDLGMQGEDGYVTLIGRNKDLVISGGFNIYPKEVEDVLDALPGVVESAVIGVPHPDLGEAAVAVLVADARCDTKEVAARASEKLARYKCPRHYVTLDALPRNTMGKVQKAALRRQFETVFAEKG